MLQSHHFLDHFDEKHSHACLLVGKNRTAAEGIMGDLARRLGVSPFDTHLVTEEGIGHIRALRARLSLKPHSSSHHLVFVPQAESLTPEAQNALLKILEEPPAPTVFLLATPDERLLLPTVVSRCQKISLPAEAPSAESPTDLLSMRQNGSIGERSLREQFALAEVLAKEEGLPDLLDGWILSLRGELKAGSREAGEMIAAILAAKEKATATEANKRLILEDLFLSITYPRQ